MSARNYEVYTSSHELFNLDDTFPNNEFPNTF